MSSEDVVGKSTGETTVNTIVNNLAEEAKLATQGVKAPGHAILSVCKSLVAGGVAGGVWVPDFFLILFFFNIFLMLVLYWFFAFTCDEGFDNPLCRFFKLRVSDSHFYFVSEESRVENQVFSFKQVLIFEFRCSSFFFVEFGKNIVFIISCLSRKFPFFLYILLDNPINLKLYFFCKFF